MERLLVTSIDDPLGSNLALQLSDRCDVLALYDRCPLAHAALATAPWQPRDAAALEAHLDEWRPQWIVHCGRLSAPHWDPPAADDAPGGEAAVVAQLARLARQFGCRLCVVSTDAVFAGPCLFHDEDSPAENPSSHATEAREVERAALKNTEALVVRTHAYAWSAGDQTPGFAERAANALARQAPWSALSVDGCRHATPILATDLAELLWRAYQAHLEGMYHLGGAERASPHRFVSELAGLLGLPFDAVPAPRAAGPGDETSLSSKLARRTLAVATPLLRAGLARFAEQRDNGWRSQWARAEREAQVAAA